MKVLLYVDAENVSIDDSRKWVADIKESLTDDEQLVGKFYGNISKLDGVLRACYEMGLDFIETSSIIDGAKNVTDMKIIVDCIHDILSTFCGEVSRVYVLSNDCDFTPLILKLSGYPVEINAPLFKYEDAHKTVSEVSTALIDLHYYPVSEEEPFECLKNQFSVIRGLLPEQFSDSVIEKYLNKRRMKFLRASAELCGRPVMQLTEIPISLFSFEDVVPFAKSDRVTIKMLLRQYTSKFYGAYFSDNTLEKVTDSIISSDLSSVKAS